MWYIEKSVYLVEGQVNAAFYDLNNGELYQISQEAKELIKRAIDDDSNLTDIQIRYLHELEKLGIITNKWVVKHDIQELVENPVIDFVWIEVTDMCNLRCIHCYDNALCSDGKIMPINDFKHVIDELVKKGVHRIQLIGGEPFILGESLFEYLDYCVDKFEYLEIFTNGTLINDEWYQYIYNNNIKIALSVYSYNENIHNYVTQNAMSWRETNNTIKKLYEYGINYRVKNVLMRNVDIGVKNTDLYELSNKKDIVRLTGRAKLNLISDELIERKLITENNFAYKINRELVKKCLNGHNCFAKRLYFSVDLNVYPCVMERRLLHGNIRNSALDDVLKKEILHFNKDMIDECKVCEFRYCCFDCRPDSNGKNIYGKPWYCTYLPQQGKWVENVTNFINMLRSDKDKRNAKT